MHVSFGDWLDPGQSVSSSHLCVFSECYVYDRDLHVLTHSFPTRRSSVLGYARAIVDLWQRREAMAAAHEMMCRAMDGSVDVTAKGIKIGRAHVCTPGTNAHLVCSLLRERNKNSRLIPTRVQRMGAEWRAGSWLHDKLRERERMYSI